LYDARAGYEAGSDEIQRNRGEVTEPTASVVRFERLSASAPNLDEEIEILG